MTASPCLSLSAKDPHSDFSAAEAADAAGYVGLTVSSAMPGVIQLTSATEDPRGETWSLQTMSGTTRFRTVYSVATADRFALEARFREALCSEQVPHHDDFFHVPLRFARQILESEAAAFPPAPEAVQQRVSPRQPVLWGAAAALAVALTFVGFASAKADSRQQQAASLLSVAQASSGTAGVAAAAPAPRPSLRGRALDLR